MIDQHKLTKIVSQDVAHLVEAEKAYGDSWKKRGGAGAFFVLARKWDRIENQCRQKGYDIFEASNAFEGKDGLLDDIQDLRRYLVLVEEHVTGEK
jgi:hypothetical protein